MFGLPVMVAVVVFTLSAFTNAAGDKGCPAVDPLGHTVLLPNPADCSTFFSCSEGVPILMHCPDGLHFNAELDVCDWPQDAGCEPPKGPCYARAWTGDSYARSCETTMEVAKEECYDWFDTPHKDICCGDSCKELDWVKEECL